MKAQTELIEGVRHIPLRQFIDERGKVMHMLRATDKHFDKFGEIYFSTCNPGVIKAWMHHKQNTNNFAVVRGKCRVVLYDMREGSPTKSKVNEFVLGEDQNNYALLKIPPGVVYGFGSLENTPVVLANSTTLPHDPEDNFKIDRESGEIPYTWK